MTALANPWLILGILAALVVAFFSGMHQHAIMDDAALVGAIQQAAAQSELAAEKSAEREAGYLTKVRVAEGKANDLLKRLRKAVPGMPECPVPASVVGLLNESIGVPVDTAPAAKPDATATPADPVDCRAVIENAAENYSTVCRPNAEQLSSLQAWVMEFCRR